MISPHLSFVEKVQWFCLDTNYLWGSRVRWGVQVQGSLGAGGQLGGDDVVPHFHDPSRAPGTSVHLETPQQPLWAAWLSQSCWGAVIREVSLKTLMPFQFGPNSPSPYPWLNTEQCWVSLLLMHSLSQVCLPEERSCWEAEPFHLKMSFSYCKCCLFLMKGEEKQDSPQRLSQQFMWQPRWHNPWAEFLVNSEGHGLTGCKVWPKMTTKVYVPLDSTENKCHSFFLHIFSMCTVHSASWVCLQCCGSWWWLSPV